jgi:dephospho-CoA kinase
MAAQLTRNDRIAKADYVVDNSGDLNELYAQAEALHEHLLHLV